MTTRDIGPAVFLCGPMTNVTDNGKFKNEVRRQVERIAERLESSGFLVLSAHREEQFGDRIPKRPSEVFHRDWNFAQISKAMVFVLPSDAEGKLIRSDGTFMELGWAIALEKPFFIVIDPRATGRSYLFDGLLEVASRMYQFKFEEAMQGDEFLACLKRELNTSQQLT